MADSTPVTIGKGKLYDLNINKSIEINDEFAKEVAA